MARPSRVQGFDYRGLYQYFLTFCTFERRHVLCDATVAPLVLLHFRRTACVRKFAILAYCLMPDHVHLLVEGLAEKSDLRKFAKRMKQSSGQAYANHAKRPLWQEGYFDRVLRNNEDATDVARYIIANPLRAGLVSKLSDYSYIGSDVWSLDELIDGLL
jgi:putative transposase